MVNGAQTGKKHPCPDCAFCQRCSDDRCRLCLDREGKRRKLSMEEQIALYEVINGRGKEKDDK